MIFNLYSFKKIKFNKKYISILLLIILIPYSGVKAAKSAECIKPEKLKALDQILANKVASIKTTDKEVVSDVFWGYKSELITRIVEKTFSKEYKDAFNNYIENFKKIEASYQEGLLSEDDIKVRNFHYYILADTIPVLLNDRLFFDVRPVSPERDLEKQASKEKIWMELSKELDSRNLRICRDKENTKKTFKNNSEKDKKYKTILEDPWLKTMDFSANYEIPIPVAVNFLSDPKSSEVSDKKGVLGWIKNSWNLITGNEEDRAKEMEKESEENQITSSISPKAKLFLAFEREYNIKSRYLDWRNDRNFWIEKTNKVSGYNLDIFVEKYEIMLDNILKTNNELKESLEAIEIICQSQRVNIPCWLNGNIIPKHSNSDNKKSYKYRTAESDN